MKKMHLKLAFLQWNENPPTFCISLFEAYRSKKSVVLLEVYGETDLVN